jgi:quercetin dioxygenase-like cupin family protein
MYALPSATGAPRRELVEEIVIVAGIYFRTVTIEEAELVPQHVHDESHATQVCSGRVRLWVEGQWIGDFGPGVIEIEGGKLHTFLALERSRLSCVWREDVAMRMIEREV